MVTHRPAVLDVVAGILWRDGRFLAVKRPEGKPMAYVNSLLNLSVAINMGNFAAVHKVESGAEWHVVVSKVGKAK